MSSIDITGQHETLSSSSSDNAQLDRRNGTSVRDILEPIFVFVCAVAVFAAQVFLSHSPVLSLLFDSHGFLAAGSAVLQAANAQSFHGVVELFRSGFSESMRLHAAACLAPAVELVKTGPLMPLTLALAYAVAGKQAVTANWQIGTWAMIAVQALTVTLMFVAARRAWGRTTAITTALIALSYGALSISAGRIMSETPAALVVTFFTLASLWSICETPFKTVKSGFIVGTATALVMLSRATLMGIPLAVGGVMAADAWLRREFRLDKKWLVGLIVGITLALAPWVFFKYVMTGQPSILIDRRCPWNLYCGINLSTDGFDVLPTDYVAHPDTFVMPSSAIAKFAINEITTQPVQFISLMLRKFPRLMAFPWNDYDHAFLGIPAWIQTWWHQCILLLAAFGFLLSMQGHPSKDKQEERADITRMFGLVLAVTAAYHLVQCLFITISRYWFTAMPAVILLAGYGLIGVWRMPRRRVALLAATIAVPTVCALVECACSARASILAKIALQTGLTAAAIGAALLVAGAVLCWFAVAAVGIRARGHLLACWVAFSLIATVISFVSTFHRAQVFEYAWSGNQTLNVAIPIPAMNAAGAWYLIVDYADGDSSLKPPAISLGVNGSFLNGELSPLWATDLSQREYLMYSRAVAYSYGVDVKDLRQWFCLKLPDGAIKSGANNTLQIDTASGKNAYFFADLLERGQKEHSLSLRNFSWSKGSYVDTKGELRMDDWTEGDQSTAQASPAMRPRVYLLFVGMPVDSAVTPAISINVPPIKVASRDVKPYVVSLASLGKLNLAGTNGLVVTVSGQCRSLDKAAHDCSASLVETTQSGEAFAALAPGFICATAQPQEFRYCDVLKSSDGPSSLRLLLAVRNWWEVLDYGLFRGSGSVQFDHIKILVQPQAVPNLDAQRWQLFKPASISGRRLAGRA